MNYLKNIDKYGDKNYEKNNDKKSGTNQYIFKKKKINKIAKEEKNNNDKYFSVKTPINNTKKKFTNLVLTTKLKQNNKSNNNSNIKPALKAHNLFILKEKEKKSNLNQKTNEKDKDKYQRIKYNEIINNNNDDTISLSYSKEQNISFFSKKLNNFDKKIYPPFSIEQFFINYNKKNQNLEINDKNEKTKKNFDNISDDDEYQLTKEIILLKRGLAKRSELSAEMKKRLRNIRMQRVYILSLIGKNKIYKKKTSTYKL